MNLNIESDADALRLLLRKKSTRKKTYKDFESLQNKVKLLDKALKTQPENAQDVIIQLEKGGIRVSDADKRYFEALLALRSINRKFIVNKALLNMTLSVFYFTKIETEILSTDLLFNLALFTRAYGKNLDFDSSQGKIDYFSIVSQYNFRLEKESVQEYFIQDFSPETFISFSLTPANKADNDYMEKVRQIKKASEYTFRIDSLTYEFLDCPLGYIVLPRSLKLDEYLSKAKALPIENKKSLKDGLISLPKYGEFCYVQSKLEPTLFCPFIVYFPQSFDFDMSIKINIEPNTFINSIIANKEIKKTYSDIFIMENFYCFPSYCGILSFSLKTGDLANELLNFYTSFLTVSSHVKLEQSLFEKFRDSCSRYLDIFGYNIKILRIRKLLDYLRDVINQFENQEYFLSYGSFLNKYKELISKHSNLKLIPNYLNFDKVSCLKLMVRSLQSLIYFKKKDSVDKLYELTTQTIEKITSFYHGGTNVMFNQLRVKINYQTFFAEFITQLENDMLIELEQKNSAIASETSRELNKAITDEKLSTIGILHNLLAQKLVSYKANLDKEASDQIQNLFSNYAKTDMKTEDVLNKLSAILSSSISKLWGIPGDTIKNDFANVKTKKDLSKDFEYDTVKSIIVNSSSKPIIDFLKPYFELNKIRSIFETSNNNIKVIRSKLLTEIKDLFKKAGKEVDNEEIDMEIENEEEKQQQQRINNRIQNVREGNIQEIDRGNRPNVSVSKDQSS